MNFNPKPTDVTAGVTADPLRASHHFDGWTLTDRDPDVLRSLMPIWGWFYEHYFRVTTDGWEHVPDQGQAFLVGSHNGGFAAPDTFMLCYEWFRRFGVERPCYGLMHPAVWKISPWVARLAAQMGAIMAHPKMAIAALEQDAAVLVYPGGGEDLYRPYALRHQIYFAERKGFIKLALRHNLPIIPVISRGAHDTLIVLGDIYPQMQQLHRWGMPWLLGLDPVVFPIYLGLPWGIGFGPLPNIPLPTQIHIRICAPIVFERYGRAAAKDFDYVNACYNTVVSKMQRELDGLVQEAQPSPTTVMGGRAIADP